jgi:hypothetical protein
MIIELDAESQPSNDHAVADAPTYTSDTVPGPGPEGNFLVEQRIESIPWPHQTFMIRNWVSN